MSRLWRDVRRDVRQRRQARVQQAADIEATVLLQRAGHAPLCAGHMVVTGKCRCEEAHSLGWVPENAHRREGEP